MMDKIKNFLLTNPEISPRVSGDINESQSLVEAGILDSFGIITLIAFLEEAFNFRISAEDLVQENFETLNAICQFVEQKTANT